MFNEPCKYTIRRENKNYIYNFKTSSGVEFDVTFDYLKAGKCELIYKNLNENSYDVQNYKNSTSIEVFSTLVSIINDFNDLVIPDEMVLGYNKKDPISRYKLTKKLVIFFIRKYRNKKGFENITFEEIDKDNKILFVLKRNISNTLLQLKRKRLNRE